MCSATYIVNGAATVFEAAQVLFIDDHVTASQLHIYLESSHVITHEHLRALAHFLGTAVAGPHRELFHVAERQVKARLNG